MARSRPHHHAAGTARQPLQDQPQPGMPGLRSGPGTGQGAGALQAIRVLDATQMLAGPLVATRVGGEAMSRSAAKVAIVTGTCSGIGATSAMRLADEGASVVLAGINEDAEQSVAAGSSS